MSPSGQQLSFNDVCGMPALPLMATKSRTSHQVGAGQEQTNGTAGKTRRYAGQSLPPTRCGATMALPSRH
jgi:hypothetical protein